jgi:hypothetical protein
MDYSQLWKAINEGWFLKRSGLDKSELNRIAYQDTLRHRMLGFMTRAYYQRKKLIAGSEVYYAYVFQNYDYDENQRENGGATWLVFSPSEAVNSNPLILKEIAAKLQQLKMNESKTTEEKALKKLLIEPLSETSYFELPSDIALGQYVFFSIIDCHKELIPSFHLGLNLVLANPSLSKEVLYFPQSYWNEEWKEAYLSSKGTL